MRRFVFRAQAALDLRRSREQAALSVQASAAAALSRAEASVRDADHDIAEATLRWREAREPAVCTWHRNWMVRLRYERDRRSLMVRDRRAALEAATAAALAAHRDLRALERLHERALTAWKQDERRREQKDLDWLGTLRQIRRRAESREEVS